MAYEKTFLNESVDDFCFLRRFAEPCEACRLDAEGEVAEEPPNDGRPTLAILVLVWGGFGKADMLIDLFTIRSGERLGAVSPPLEVALSVGTCEME